MTIKPSIVLAIETAIGGGSLSILQNTIEIDRWEGETNKISRSEYLLTQISNLLEKNQLEKQQINLIGVSKDTGSLTGEKIGLAIAKGLSRAINCSLIEIPVLDALSSRMPENAEGKFIAALVTGENRILWQVKEKLNTKFRNLTSKPESCNRLEFAQMLQAENCNFLVLATPANYDFSTTGDTQIITEFTNNLTALIGKFAYASDNL